MHKVLVPIDGSESATRALQYAVKLARESDLVSLHLLNVQPEPVSYGEIQVYVSKDRLAELQRLHSTDLLRPAAELAKGAGVSHTSEMDVGDIAPSIVKKCRELGCDAIVMGTRGMGALGNFALGSIASKVVHLSEVPVTLVK